MGNSALAQCQLVNDTDPWEQCCGASQPDVALEQSIGEATANVGEPPHTSVRAQAPNSTQLNEQRHEAQNTQTAGNSAIAIAIADGFRPEGFSEEEMVQQVLHLSQVEEESRCNHVVRPGNPNNGIRQETGAGAQSSFAPRSPEDEAIAMAIQASQAEQTRPATIRTDEDDPSLRAALAASMQSNTHVASNMYDDDAGLRAALAASMQANAPQGSQETEDELLAKVMRASQLEEEARQRQRLRDEQDAELQESLAIDQSKNADAERRQREAAQVENERQRETAQIEDERLRLQNQRAARVEEALKRMPEEPPANEKGRVDILVRTKDGKRLRRAFRSSDLVGSVYDFVGVESGMIASGSSYQLVTTMPRCVYNSTEITLAEAEIRGQCALLIECLDD